MMNPLLEIAEVSVGQHYYWKVGEYELHGQVLMVSWFVLGVIFVLSFLGNRDLKSTPDGFQNFTEFVTEFIRGATRFPETFLQR
jgi:F-type H+-transporting ATPase subunit a